MRVVGCVAIAGLVLLAVVGCSNPEDKAAPYLQKAEQAEKSGQTEMALELYRRVVSAYPRTTAAEQARSKIPRLQKFLAVRKDRELAAARKILDRIRRIVDGYRAMYHRFPKSVADIDDGQFFFDSGYMADAVPEGYLVFLALGETPGGFRVWAFPRGRNYGLGFDSRRDGYQTVEKGPDALLAGVKGQRN